MKKTIFIVFFFCALPFISKSQDALPILTRSNVSDISSYISKSYQLKEKTLDTLCLYTTVFIKFKLSNKGKIDSLTLSESAPHIIKKELEKAVKSSNGHWSNLHADLEYFSKKTFILPVVLFYARGCQEGDGELSLNVPVGEYRKIYNTTRNANYAVQEILKFNGKYLSMLECVILSPMSMGDSNY